jgi:hypothetical protein
VTAGVIFPFADSRRVRDLFAGFLTRDENDPLARYQPVSGQVELAAGQIDLIMPESQRRHSMLMREDIAADLRGWLVEPDFFGHAAPTAGDGRKPAAASRDPNRERLSPDQGVRRVRQVVLAARAARLADEGKSVLVATFNITLWHYLRDLVVRALKVRGGHRNVVFVNFHSWCKQVCMEVGWSEAYDELWKSGDGASVMEAALPSLVASAAAEEDSPRYDAILVDEGQDYRPLWWNTLRRFLQPGGEMILAADATQDVYGTAQAWTNEAMAGAGFGAWAQLDVSYRLPPATLPLIQSFVTSFLPERALSCPVRHKHRSICSQCHCAGCSARRSTESRPASQRSSE